MWFCWAHSAVVARPLCKRKAPGSIPGVSNSLCDTSPFSIAHVRMLPQCSRTRIDRPEMPSSIAVHNCRPQLPSSIAVHNCRPRFLPHYVIGHSYHLSHQCFALLPLAAPHASIKYQVSSTKHQAPSTNHQTPTTRRVISSRLD